MIETILGVLSSSGLGVIFGTVGSFLTRIEERKLKKLQFEHEHSMAELSLKESELDRVHELSMADKDRQRVESEGEVAQDMVDATSFQESVKGAFKTTGIKIVDGIRAMMRPLITTYLLVISSILVFKIMVIAGGLESLEQSIVAGMYQKVISDIFFLTTTAVTWWFGTRNTDNRSK